MTVKFLCDKHRAMLNDHPGKAINAWQDSFDQGRGLYDNKQWRQALPFLGSAYETAAIIMQSKALEQSSAYELLTTSAVLLANTFVMLGYEAEGRRVYRLAIYRLEQETANSMQQRLCINQFIGHLCRNIRRIECNTEKTGVPTSTALQLMSATLH